VSAQQGKVNHVYELIYVYVSHPKLIEPLSTFQTMHYLQSTQNMMTESLREDSRQLRKLRIHLIHGYLTEFFNNRMMIKVVRKMLLGSQQSLTYHTNNSCHEAEYGASLLKYEVKITHDSMPLLDL
jgi:hypothetical protein